MPGLLARERLGGGTITESWLAWSEPLWCPVVVKVAVAARGGDAGAAALAREARTLRRLRHPAVRRLLAAHHGDPAHLILEHVEGPTLAAVVREDGPVEPGDVVRLGLQLAACLHFMHGLGLVHLGLRPAAVALADGRAVLLDVGDTLPVGRRCPREGDPGDRRYAAPEQCVGGRADPAMDLFALGAVLYELATAQPAFAPNAAAAGCWRPQLLEAPPRARFVQPRLPIDVDIAIHALLERRPALRPRTALEAIRLLAAALPAGSRPAWPPFVDVLLARSPGAGSTRPGRILAPPADGPASRDA